MVKWHNRVLERNDVVLSLIFTKYSIMKQIKCRSLATPITSVSWKKHVQTTLNKLERAGVTSPVVNVNCKYKKTTSYPDLIKITTTISKISRVKLTLKYTMKVADELVCSTESSHCFLDGNGRIIDLKTKMPEFYAALQELNQK